MEFRWILFLTSKWQYICTLFLILGPDLPYSLDGAEMVSSPDNQGVIILGGKHWKGTWNLYNGTYPNEFWELKSEDTQWRKLPISLKYPRECFLVLPLSNEHVLCH